MLIIRSVPSIGIAEPAQSRSFDSGADGLMSRPRRSRSGGGQGPGAQERRRPPKVRKNEGASPTALCAGRGLDTAEIDADLSAVMPFAPDGAVLTRPLNGQALQHLGALLAVKEARCGLPDGSTRIIAGVGDAAASILDMGSLAGASQRLTALFWNATALSAALGAERSRGSDGCYTTPYILARSLTLYTARAADVLAIDAACPRAPEGVGLRLECEAARRDGFDGKLALDRDQVAIINAVFTPTDEAIARARAIVAAFATEPAAATCGLDGEILASSDFAQASRLLRRTPAT